MKIPSIFLLLILYNYMFLISKCVASERTQIGDGGEQGDSIIGNFSFLMPGVRPTHNDAYFCMEMIVESAMFIVDFHLVLDNPNLHHMIILGSEHSINDISPKRKVENISMNKTINRTAPVACDNSTIHNLGKSSNIFAWTPMTSNANLLPKGNNQRLGKHVKIHYFSLQ
jgi:hypothetical protein